MNNITVIGTGYVGLVSGACLSEFGNKVICSDIDKDKIKKLNNGIIPIYEPGLKELVDKNILSKRLVFSFDVEKAIKDSQIVIIAVGTPSNSNGEADLSAVDSVIIKILDNINSYKIICIKSTVPIGTGVKISKFIKSKLKENQNVDYVSNPEFLREGSAVRDFLWPDRVVIGTESSKAFSIMRDIYRPLYINKNPILETSVTSAEVIKYASNAFLALKISYINEVANLCDVVGADIHDISKGMGLDGRISNKFLHPGPGFGGSCFPKDISALLKYSKKNNTKLGTVESAIKANSNQKEKMILKLKSLLKNDFEGKTIAILGLAFKQNTDDVRESPAISMIQGIIDNKGLVNAYDPIASYNMGKYFPDINYFNSIEKAVNKTHAIVIMTEWNEFRSLNFKKLKKSMEYPAVLDTRNITNIQNLIDLGFKYSTVGRGSNVKD